MAAKNNDARAIMLLSLLAGSGLAGIAACSSNESATAGRWGYWPVPFYGANPNDVRDAEADRSAPTKAVDIPMPHHGMNIEIASEMIERTTGLKLSPEERSRVDQCPRRPWSKNVPNRACTNHGECGDGFCDRGQCTAIYTCFQNLGSRCETDKHCPYLLCIDGRCSSCVSHDECKKREGNDDYVCQSRGVRPPGHTCGPGPWTMPPYDKKSRCPYEPPDKKPDYCNDPGPDGG